MPDKFCQNMVSCHDFAQSIEQYRVISRIPQNINQTTFFAFISASFSNLTPHFPLVKFLLYSQRPSLPTIPCHLQIYHAHSQLLIQFLLTGIPSVFHSVYRNPFCLKIQLLMKPFKLIQTIGLFLSLIVPKPKYPFIFPVTLYVYHMILILTSSCVCNLHINAAYKFPCIDSSVFPLAPYSVIFIEWTLKK